MKKLSELEEFSLNKKKTDFVFGGSKEIKTKDDNSPELSDTWYDNDNNGKWSPGDSLTLVWN